MSIGLLQVFHVEIGTLQGISNWNLYLNLREEGSNSVNPHRVQVLSYSKYFLWVLQGLNLQMISSRNTFEPNTLSAAPCVLGGQFRIIFWDL